MIGGGGDEISTTLRKEKGAFCLVTALHAVACNVLKGRRGTALFDNTNLNQNRRT